MILSLPALEHLKTGDTEIWTPSRTVPLIRFVHRVRAISSTGLDLIGITDDARALKSLSDFDEIVSWYGTKRPEFRQAVADLPIRFFDALPDGAELHATDYFLQQVGGRAGEIPAIHCPRRDGGFIAIHPFSGSPAKNWSLERYFELARQLNADVRFCRGAEQALDGAVCIPDLWDLACWLASAQLYLGNDSGITHLAAAVGTPTIALFGPTDPNVWAPRGDNVTVLTGNSMDSISIDEVLEAANVRRKLN